MSAQREGASLVRMTRSGVPTRAERVHRELRADILAGRQRPGSRLPFAELSTRYGVSMGVAREALTRLTAEGLVESQPQHGFLVKQLSVADLKDLTGARCAIETLVLREAIEHGGLAWESEALASHHRMTRTPQMAADDPDRVTEEWAAAHAAYHLALLSGCPNPRLLAVAASLRDSAELYRRWSVPLGQGDRDIAAEHRALLDAVLAREGTEATRVLTAHIHHTTDLLLDRTDHAASDG